MRGEVFDYLNRLGNRLIDLNQKARSKGGVTPEEDMTIRCLDVFASYLHNGKTAEEARDAGELAAKFWGKEAGKTLREFGVKLVDTEYRRLVKAAGQEYREGQCRVLVFGTRTFSDSDLLRNKLDTYTSKLKRPIIVLGGGRKADQRTGSDTGADWHAEKWAKSRGHDIRVFPPDLEKHGSPAAYHIRNRQMVYYAIERRPAFAVGFWDGQSKGTLSMVEMCREHKVVLKVVRF